MKKTRTPTFPCPTHPDTYLHRLKYQKASGKETSGGNRGTEWITTEWYLCEKCGVPVKIQVTTKVLQKA